jgi:hypothetical protein
VILDRFLASVEEYACQHNNKHEIHIGKYEIAV